MSKTREDAKDGKFKSAKTAEIQNMQTIQNMNKLKKYGDSTVHKRLYNYINELQITIFYSLKEILKLINLLIL